MDQNYRKIAENIIDKWLDEGYKLTDVIEHHLRLVQINDFETAAELADNKGQKELARQIRVLKPRKFILKEQ